MPTNEELWQAADDAAHKAENLAFADRMVGHMGAGPSAEIQRAAVELRKHADLLRKNLPRRPPRAGADLLP